MWIQRVSLVSAATAAVLLACSGSTSSRSTEEPESTAAFLGNGQQPAPPAVATLVGCCILQNGGGIGYCWDPPVPVLPYDKASCTANGNTWVAVGKVVPVTDDPAQYCKQPADAGTDAATPCGCLYANDRAAKVLRDDCPKAPVCANAKCRVEIYRNGEGNPPDTEEVACESAAGAGPAPKNTQTP